VDNWILSHPSIVFLKELDPSSRGFIAGLILGNTYEVVNEQSYNSVAKRNLLKPLSQLEKLSLSEAAKEREDVNVALENVDLDDLKKSTEEREIKEMQIQKKEEFKKKISDLVKNSRVLICVWVSVSCMLVIALGIFIAFYLKLF